MNEFFNHAAIQETKKNVLEMKEIIDKVRFPAENLLQIKQLCAEIERRIQTIFVNTNDLQEIKTISRSFSGQISSAVRSLVSEFAYQFERHFKSFRIVFGTILIFSILNLGALMWLIVKSFH